MIRSTPPADARRWLTLAGALSALAAVMHVAIIFGGPDWYRFFGAGEGMARMAEQGLARPTLITLGIAGVLGAWATYAFSGAGLIRRLPLLRTALVLISAVYLLRAAVLPLMLIAQPHQVSAFVAWSSAIVLGYGLAYAIGTARGWSSLRKSI